MRVTVEVTVAAPIEEVWRAYTTPEDIKQWNAASDDWHTTAATVDLRVGGDFSSRMEAKDGSMGFDFAGTYTDVVKHKLIEYSFGDRKAQVEFADSPKGVRVCVTFDSEGSYSIEQQRDGWQAILDNFTRHVEAGRKLLTSQGRNHMAASAKNKICIWYNGGAEEAARFYAATFADSIVGTVFRAPGDFPSGKKGDVLTVEFTVMGIPCIGLNGGPEFAQSEAFSFQVATTDQAETDRYWNAIVGNGGLESACGWCKDKWGVSWQITPVVLTSAIADPDPVVAKRAFDAMMEMTKINVSAIEAAVRG